MSASTASHTAPPVRLDAVREHNELRQIIARASAAIDALTDVGMSIRELHVIAEESDAESGRLHSVNALTSAFAALNEVCTIARLAQSALAEKRVIQ